MHRYMYEPLHEKLIVIQLECLRDNLLGKARSFGHSKANLAGWQWCSISFTASSQLYIQPARLGHSRGQHYEQANYPPLLAGRSDRGVLLVEHQRDLGANRD